MSLNKFKVIGNGSFGSAIHHILKKSNCVISDIDYDFVIPAVPSYAVEDVLSDQDKGAIVIFVSKGLRHDTKMLGEWADEIGMKWAVFAGPHFAFEIKQDLPTCSIYGYDHEIPAISQWNNMNVKFSKLKFEIQMLGVLKNIYACFCGIVQSLGLNFRAVVITKIIHEIKKIFKDLGLNQDMILDYAGIADLLLTCTSTMSRNVQEGVNLTQGVRGNHLSEARHSAAAFHKRFGEKYPVCNFVYNAINNANEYSGDHSANYEERNIYITKLLEEAKNLIIAIN